MKVFFILWFFLYLIVVLNLVFGFVLCGFVVSLKRNWLFVWDVDELEIFRVVKIFMIDWGKWFFGKRVVYLVKLLIKVFE